MDGRMIFDYNKAAENENVPQDVLSRIVSEAQIEFPFDEMMRELHIIRAIKSYAIKEKTAAS